MDDDDLLWTLGAGVATLGAAAIARKLLSKGWKARRGLVPGTPGDGKTSWGEAVAFSLLSGVVVGLARLLADRGVEAAKSRSASTA